jgi:hypothetical protein
MPKCAACGGSLSRSGRIIITFEGLPGRPAVGWHVRDKDEFGCAFRDELAKQLMPSEAAGGKAGTQQALREIERRGPGRLVATRAWNASNVGAYIDMLAVFAGDFSTCDRCFASDQCVLGAVYQGDDEGPTQHECFTERLRVADRLAVERAGRAKEAS